MTEISDSDGDAAEADTTPTAVVVADAPERSEYVATVDGREVGVLKYERPEPDVIDLQHTIVRPEAKGMGVGSAIIRDALDQARLSGDRVIPTCPFVQAFLEKHPDRRDVVDR